MTSTWTRPPELRLHLDPGEIVVDSFAGGGGTSQGIEWALGRSPDLAINHDAAAIAMHAANHPRTRHLCEDVWAVNPVEACAGRPVGLAWFSPDCKHFSKAKGGKPLSKKIRGLAWVVTRWARAVRPRVIVVENVEEFQDWGPLLLDGRPCPERRGRTFKSWLAQLKNLGYHCEVRQLRACDFGAPTIRRRLFVIARRDARPIVWPAPTHGPGTSRPYLVAADVIDWTLPCPSIFERARPLAENTLRRIARGIQRYVVEAAEPFVIPVTHGGDARAHSVREPVRTVTGAHRGDLALVSSTLIQTGYGERPGQDPRVPGLDKPLGTIVAGGCKHALVSAFLAKHYGGPNGHQATGSAMADPFSSVTSRDHHALVTSHMVKLYGTCPDGQQMGLPFPTVRAGGTHLAEVRAFLLKYYSGGDGQQQELFAPLHTVTTKDRFAVVTVHGERYVIADIGMRMLAPRELFRAQGFRDTYQIDIKVDGKPLTKEAQVRMVGNSVCPDVAAAIVRANFAAEDVGEEREAVSA
jgi:DNA (cytosine-5)-methyltransferase 1